MLIRGDARYNDTESEFELASFLFSGAVLLEERVLSALPSPTRKNLKLHRVQGEEKCVAQLLLKRQGFEDQHISFEEQFYGSIPDVLARKDDALILVECCSCRVSKIIEYLSAIETKEAWIITSLDFEDVQWFVFQRGKGWEEVFSRFEALKRRRLREAHKRVFRDF